jgi:hypothetical protein
MHTLSQGKPVYKEAMGTHKENGKVPRDPQLPGTATTHIREWATATRPNKKNFTLRDWNM